MQSVWLYLQKTAKHRYTTRVTHPIVMVIVGITVNVNSVAFICYLFDYEYVQVRFEPFDSPH